MYRDKTLIPAEAIRLAVLGTLANGPRAYGDLSREVRAFAARVAGPSLDIMGSSVELMRLEGLLAPTAGGEMNEASRVAITPDGRTALGELLRANVRGPADGASRLVLALKLRFLHVLTPAEQREQVDLMLEMSENERARLADLHDRHAGEPGRLNDWLALEIDQVEARIAWFEDLLAQV